MAGGDHRDADGLWPAQAVANHALAGVGAIDTVTAMATMPLFDGVRLGRRALRGRLGFDAGAAARRVSPGTAADRRGRRRRALGGGTVDAFAEQLVAGADEPGDVLVLCGTTLITWARHRPGGPRSHGLWTVPHTRPASRWSAARRNAGGLFVDSVRRLLGPVDDGELDGLVPGDVPVWLPYLRGERTPLHDPDRRGELRRPRPRAGPGGRPARRLRGDRLRRAPPPRARRASPRRAASSPPAAGPACAPWMQALADGTGLPVDVVGRARGRRPRRRVPRPRHRRPRTGHLRRDRLEPDRWPRRAEAALGVGPATSRYAIFLERTRR